MSEQQATEKEAPQEFRVCWLDGYGEPRDHTQEDGPHMFATLDEALEWDVRNSSQLFGWVEARPVVEWSTGVIPPGSSAR